jgi:hypothetical protein
MNPEPYEPWEDVVRDATDAHQRIGGLRRFDESLLQLPRRETRRIVDVHLPEPPEQGAE